jgi:protein TonB
MGYAQEDRAKRAASMGMAVAVNGSIIAAIMLSPLIVNRLPDRPITNVHNVKNDPPPPVVPVDPAIKPEQDIKPAIEPIFVPKRAFEVERESEGPTTTEETSGTSIGTGGTEDFGKGGGESVTREIIDDIPKPIFKASKRDPRYAKAFQPEYPSGLLVKEIEGDAVLKVLVGIDGRVREAVVVRASHPDFGKAAVKQALKSWRFIPATRGGQPVEDWQTLPIRFNIDS